jgi:hypothetical protein
MCTPVDKEIKHTLATVTVTVIGVPAVEKLPYKLPPVASKDQAVTTIKWRRSTPQFDQKIGDVSTSYLCRQKQKTSCPTYIT